MTSISIHRGDARAVRDARARASARVFQHSARDGWLFGAALAMGVGLAASVPLVVHGGVKTAAVVASLVGFAIVWGSNTVSHNHLHNPIFARTAYNRAFSVVLSVVLGVPQTVWRARHLWHHAGEPKARKPLRPGALGWIEIGLVAATWIALAALAPRFFFLAYAPGYLLGMGLCRLQGRYEHTNGLRGTSHYGALHNALWFNDGYHVEHHARPRAHWTRLPALRASASAGTDSRFPPLLRFFEDVGTGINLAQAHVLGALERLVLRSRLLQRLVVDWHAGALRALLPALAGRPLDRIVIVGGGLFPRTALALGELLPESRLVIVDASAESIQRARDYLAARAQELGVAFVQAEFHAHAGLAIDDIDLLVVPLAFVGDRGALYDLALPAPALVHDWIWRPRGASSAVISLALLKRLNLVLPIARDP